MVRGRLRAAQGGDECGFESRCLAVRVMPRECCRVALGLGCEAGRLEAGAMQEAAVEAVGGGPAVKRSYGAESCGAKRTGSAIKKENRTVGCLQTRTDTDRQAQAGGGGVRRESDERGV